MHFMRFSPALAVIARGAGSDDVCPDMLSTHVAGNNVIHSQVAFAFSTILAGIIVAAEYFTTR